MIRGDLDPGAVFLGAVLVTFTGGAFAELAEMNSAPAVASVAWVLWGLGAVLVVMSGLALVARRVRR